MAQLMRWWQWTFLVLLAAAFVVDRTVTQLDNKEMQKEVSTFMHTGPRNTAEQGFALCERIAHLELEHHKRQHDLSCEEIYFPNKE